MSLHEFEEYWDQIEWRYAVPKLMLTAFGIAIWFLGIWKAIELAILAVRMTP